MKRTIFALLLLSPLLSTNLLAHEVRATVDTSPAALAIRVEYGDGEPFSYERYEIYPPPASDDETKNGASKTGEEPPPFQTGRTDANGQILFLPDRPGTWTIRYMSEDGHGGETVVEVSPSRTASLRGVPLYLRFSRVITGIGFFLGIGGAFSLYGCYKKRKNTGS